MKKKCKCCNKVIAEMETKENYRTFGNCAKYKDVLYITCAECKTINKINLTKIKGSGKNEK